MAFYYERVTPVQDSVFTVIFMLYVIAFTVYRVKMVCCVKTAAEKSSENFFANSFDNAASVALGSSLGSSLDTQRDSIEAMLGSIHLETCVYSAGVPRP